MLLLVSRDVILANGKKGGLKMLNKAQHELFSRVRRNWLKESARWCKELKHNSK
jgi:hypothetical protein